MAYLVGSAQTFGTATVTVSANMPPHQADDYLICYVTTDSGTITLPTSGGGGGAWAALTSAPANPVSNGIVTYLSFLKATSANETFPSVVMPDAYTVTIFCFRDVDTTTPFDGVTPINTTSASGYTATATAPTATNTADALVVYLFAQETPSTTPSQVLIGPNVMWIDGGDTGGVTATTSAHQCSAWHILRSANMTAPTPIAVSGVTSTWTKATFCLRNKSGGRIPAYIDDAISAGSMITGGQHIGSGINNITASTNGITATINGKTATPATATIVGDLGLNFYCNALSSATAQTPATALVGPEITLTTPIDASTGGLIMGVCIGGTQKMGGFGLGTVANGGAVVRLGSGTATTTAWNAYQVAAKDSKVVPTSHTLWAIEAGYTGSSYANGTTNCSATAVKFLQFLRNTPYQASSQLCYAEIHYVNTQNIAGGDANFPVDVAGLVAAGKSFRLPVIQQAGSNGCVIFAPVKIGGADAVNFNIDAGALQFPTRASAATKDLQFHASDNKVGIDFAGKSGDTIKLTNSIVSSGTPFTFTINASATSAATWDFSGTTVVNGTVTLRPVMTFSNMAFSGCQSITTTGSSMSNCKFSNSVVNVSSPANAALLTDCTFTKTTGTSHGLVITGTAADFTLDCSFAGYAAGNGSTGNEAIYVNIASGNISISYTGGGAQPSIRTAGATVVYAATPVTLTVTVKDSSTGALIQNARVLVEKVSDGADVLTGLTDVSGVVTTSFSYTADVPITGRVRRATVADGTRYKEGAVSGTITTSGFASTILLISDE